MPTPMSPDRPASSTISPAEAIEALGRGTHRLEHLRALSDLGRNDVRLLAEAWPDVSADTKAAVLRQLEQIAEDNVEYSFGRVFRAGLNDPSPVVRQLAISGLWEDESGDLIDIFVDLMESDESIDVRAEAASALARYADKVVNVELDEQSAERVRESLLDAADSGFQPELVRRRALESIAVCGGAHVDDLIARAFDSDDTATRASALYAMGRSLDRKWLGTVLTEFESDDAEMRFEAARASGELGHVDAVSGLSQLLGDPDVEVRQAAIAALGKIGGSGAIRVLQGYIQACPPSDRELVDDAIAEARLFETDIRAHA